MGKECAVTADWEHVGKFWGYIWRENLPLSDCKPLVFPKTAMIKVRRTLRRFLRSKRIRRGARTPVRLYVEEHAQWLRVMLWANDGAVPPLSMILAKRAKRAKRSTVAPARPARAGVWSGAPSPLFMQIGLSYTVSLIIRHYVAFSWSIL
jgi:hypothetical protein